MVVPTHRSVAEAYHHLTKYRAETVRAGPGIDWTRQPDQFKDIVSSRRVSLRSYLPAGVGPGTGKKEPEGFGMACIGRLLFYTYGVTGVIRFQHGGNQLLRASPSAGALYPTELYIALGEDAGVEPGLYNYQVRSHELVLVWEGDQMGALREACGGDESFLRAHACIVLTGLHWRSAWRYQERGYRRVLLDTGHVVANTLCYAPHEGCMARPILGFCDDALNGLYFFEETKEAALMCVPLIRGTQPQDCAPLWASPTTEAPGLEAVKIERDEDMEASASMALHRASRCVERRVAGDSGVTQPAPSDRSIPLAPPGDVGDRIPDAIVERRSARGYTGQAVPLERLGRALGYAFGRGPDGERTVRFPTRDAGLLGAHVVAHAVEGLDPGLYLVEGAGEALLPIRLGDLKDDMHHLALGQEIARRCGATLVFSAPAQAAVDLYGDRAYRYLHLEAGIIGERLQLAAGALSLGACGIGGFLDDDAAAVIDASPDDFVLYMVTVGRA